MSGADDRVPGVPYLWSVVVVLAALVGLGLVVGALLGPVRRAATVAAEARTSLGREAGMLSARVAALRVRLAERSEPSERSGRHA